MAVAHTLYVLLNDRPLIQIRGHIMTGGTDQLHPLVVGLLVGISPHKRRQEGVMNIDHPVGIVRDEIRAENLHVSGQHNHIHPPFQQLERLGLRFRLVVRGHRDVMVFDTEPLHFVTQVIMIADHQWDGGGHIPAGGTPQQVHEHMIVFGHQHRHALLLTGITDLPLHAIGFGHGGGKVVSQGVTGAVQIRCLEFQTQKEGATLGITGMLVKIGNVGAVIEQKGTDCTDDARLVRAGYQQSRRSGVGHGHLRS